MYADFLEYDSPPAGAVLFSRSLHHFADPQAAVRHARSLLRADGVLLVEDFDADRVDRPTATWFYDVMAFAAEICGQAFDPLAAGNPTEQFINEALRVARTLTVSLVAELRRMKVRSIQLMDAKGQVPFYAGPGFSVRPDDGPGMQFSGELPRENTAAGGQLPVTDL